MATTIGLPSLTITFQAAAQQAEDDAPRPAAQPQKPSKKESRKNAGNLYKLGCVQGTGGWIC